MWERVSPWVVGPLYTTIRYTICDTCYPSTHWCHTEEAGPNLLDLLIFIRNLEIFSVYLLKRGRFMNHNNIRLQNSSPFLVVDKILKTFNEINNTYHSNNNNNPNLKLFRL